MKTFILLLATLSLSSAAFAQPSATVPKNIRAASTLDNLFDINGLSTFDNLYGIPLEPGRVLGDAYLTDDWKRTTFLLYDIDKMIEGYSARYEIELDQFEIKTTAGIKVLSGKRVKSFVLLDSLTKMPHYFVNGRDFKNAGNTPLSGFFEVLAEGELTLLSQTEVAVKKPTYNQALDMGTRDTRLVKRTKFYYIDAEVVSELPSSRKKLLPVFGEDAPEVQSFLKLNSLSLDEPQHLKVLFEHYNDQLARN